MPTETLTIGSRGSDLALWQARWVQSALMRHFPDLAVTISIIKTTGDKILDAPLSKIGDKGLFTREIEQALLDRTIDVAVHSLKDLPTQLPDGLCIGAVTEREDVRDVFIPHPSNPVRTILDQSPRARIATGSLRRRSQLLQLRPDFEIVDLRGNLNTRIAKLDQSDWSGMILARAGVVRLGWDDRIGESIDPLTILPAVGQGALGIEIRIDDERVEEFVSILHHVTTAQATTAERSLLRSLEGGCQVPIGTYARIDQIADNPPVLRLDAIVGSIDGTRTVRGAAVGRPHDPDRIGTELAAELMRDGASEILDEIRRTS